MISLDPNQDFSFDYPALFIDTSLRHLLTAALQRIMKSGKGDIRLWISDEEDYHIFNIKDTSQSLAADQLTNLFSQFLFESYDKSRPGLGFCKLAMLHMGGDIICEIVGDECTHFQIKLPKTEIRVNHPKGVFSPSL